MWLNERKYDIIFLQETYCTAVEVSEDIWRTQWQGKLFSSRGTNHSCGVMVLVRSDLDDVNLKSVEADTQGQGYVQISSFNFFACLMFTHQIRCKNNASIFDNLNNVIKNFVVD